MYNEYNFYNDDDFSPYSEADENHEGYIDSTVIPDKASAGASGSGKPPRKKKPMGIFKKMALCAAFAAVFGLVAGGVYVGTTKLASSSSSKTVLQTAANANSTVSAENATASSSTNQSTDSSSSVGSTAASSDSGSDLSVEDVAANSMPALVSITNKSIQEVQNYFGGMGGYGNNGTQSYESTSMGSGVIIGQTDSLIYIVTNEHVIDSAQTLTVAFVDNSTAEGTVIGSDSTNDIAVVSVNKSDLSSDTLSQIKVMEIGSSDSLVVGQQVVAIGNALGYGQSVSTGIVSALNRSMDGGTGIYAEGLIQTDAAINPGNSGGALLNMKGQLIGINSAKYADTSVEGMGYSIPIDKVEPIIESMINGTYTSDQSTTGSTDSTSENNGNNGSNGSIGNNGSNGSTDSNSSSSSDGTVEATSDAYLGISCTGISSEYSQYYNIPEGVYISSVTSGSAAEKAGLQSGDIITSVDGTSVSSVNDLTSVLNQHTSGDTVQVTVSRQNGSSYAETTVSVTLGSRSSQKTSYNNQ